MRIRLAAKGFHFIHEVDDNSRTVHHPIYDIGHSAQGSETEGETYVTANVIKEYAKGLGLDIHYDTSLVELIKEGDRVTGIYVRTEAGYARYNTPKGVIVCTGGYSLNIDMLKALQPETVKMININYSFPGSHGDGIKACLWAGAAMDDVHAGVLFDRGGIAPDQVGCETEGVLFRMGSQPFLKVGLDGKRFTNESGCYDHILHDAFNLPGMTYAMVWDADYVEDIKRFDTHGCSRLFPHENSHCKSGAPISAPPPQDIICWCALAFFYSFGYNMICCSSHWEIGSVVGNTYQRGHHHESTRDRRTAPPVQAREKCHWSHLRLLRRQSEGDHLQHRRVSGPFARGGGGEVP